MGNYGWSRWRMLVNSDATGAVNVPAAIGLYAWGLLVIQKSFTSCLYSFMFSPHSFRLPCPLCGACIDKNCTKEDNCATALFLKYAYPPNFPSLCLCQTETDSPV